LTLELRPLATITSVRGGCADASHSLRRDV